MQSSGVEPDRSKDSLVTLKRCGAGGRELAAAAEDAIMAAGQRS